MKFTQVFSVAFLAAIASGAVIAARQSEFKSISARNIVGGSPKVVDTDTKKRNIVGGSPKVVDTDTKKRNIVGGSPKVVVDES